MTDWLKYGFNEKLRLEDLCERCRAAWTRFFECRAYAFTPCSECGPKFEVTFGDVVKQWAA